MNDHCQYCCISFLWESFSPIYWKRCEFHSPKPGVGKELQETIISKIYHLKLYTQRQKSVKVSDLYLLKYSDSIFLSLGNFLKNVRYRFLFSKNLIIF